MSAAWKQPEIRPGMFVEYKKAHTTVALPMLVLQVHDSFVSGWAWTLRGGNFYVESARHISCPELVSRPILLEEGTWDYSLIHKEVHRLEAEVRRLTDLIEGKAIAAIPAPEPTPEPAPNANFEALMAKAAELHDAGMVKADIVRATGLHHKQVDKAIRELSKPVEVVNG